ncbi:30S ribosomal protein [Dorcoceras hygrometricum]|uniref:30S ribosomal protein n=1 Tax=Dorcoceras hygrometricum TaxID=472368 RepID=A0A2Z7BGU3_9LAMI|nr:30S ribosomal protein [Dorcoceras hygrometricum]
MPQRQSAEGKQPAVVITHNNVQQDMTVEIKSTVDESVDSRYSRRLLMSNVEQEADNSKLEIKSTVDESVDSRYSRRLLMSNVEQEVDNSKLNSEIQQMILATMIQQKRKVKDSAVGSARLLRSKEEVVISKDDVSLPIGRNCEQQP